MNNVRLVICEKPAVSMAVANVLGAKTRRNGYMEGNGYLVSWCYGHLAEFAHAETYNERFKRWRYDDLPIVPDAWEYVIDKDKGEQFAVLRDLMHRDDVSEVINGCDAGREGELIFRTVYYLAGCTKTMKRLWVSSMEDEAIRRGFAELRPGSQYDGLYQAAVCRAKADWLVGINGTRLFSILYHRKLNVGRVVSPTLALIVQRECEIDAFKPEPFYTVTLDCGGFTLAGEKMKDKSAAKKVQTECAGQSVVVKSVERQEKKENPPLLFDLTTLQRTANKELGFTAQQTLDYLQSLYEKKLCTYPRTDSRYLTEDTISTLPSLVNIAAAICQTEEPGTIRTEKICNNTKVTDHHALLPTVSAGKADISVLPKGERSLLQLVARQLLCAVAEPYRVTETLVTAECAGQTFTAKGKTTMAAGWKTYLDKDTEDKVLPELSEGAELPVQSAKIKEGTTKPPAHHTEDSILHAMETAGVEDMPEDAERKGLGTPATRAGILEKLVANGFIERKKAQKTVHLIPTHGAVSLITVLPEQLQSPLLTAEWEHRLKQIEHGELAADDFLSDITEMVTDLVRNYHAVKGAEVLFPSGREVVGKCPRCGGDVIEAKKGFFCECGDCRFSLWRDNKFFQAKHMTLTKAQATELLTNGRTFVKGLYSEKTGNSYDAWVVLDDNGECVRFRVEIPKEDR